MTLDEVWRFVLDSGRSIYDPWWLKVKQLPWEEDNELRSNS